MEIGSRWFILSPAAGTRLGIPAVVVHKEVDRVVERVAVLWPVHQISNPLVHR
jgi:hypothetical protein